MKDRELSMVTPKNMKNNFAARVARSKKIKIPNFAMNKGQINLFKITRFKVRIS